MAARHGRSQHGGGVIIMVLENILFDKIDTTAVSIPEVVAIKYCEFLIVCCYRQPSTNNLTLFSQLNMLLDSNNLLSPVICGDFNVHETSWLNSSHTSTAGTAALDFCESKGLHQLVQFSTRQDAILDLILSEQMGSTSRLPNLNTSDHVAILLSLATPSHHPVITPPSCRVFHWSNAPWKKLTRHFYSIKWNFQGSVDNITTQFANTIYSSTLKFIPSCIPKSSLPTPWWNRFCEAAWQRKVKCWEDNDMVGPLFLPI